MSNEKMAKATYRCRTCHEEFVHNVHPGVTNYNTARAWAINPNKLVDFHKCHGGDTSVLTVGVGDLINVELLR